MAREFKDCQSTAVLLSNVWYSLSSNRAVSIVCVLLKYNSFNSQSHETLPAILPLSLLAFSATASALSYPIYPTYLSNACDNLSQILGLSHVFRRHVKPKKQHELIELGKVRTL